MFETEGEFLEPGFLSGAEERNRPFQAPAGQLRKTLAKISGDCTVVVIALDDDEIRFGDPVYTFGRMWAVADDIAQDQAMADVFLPEELQNRFQCRQVRMNVAE